MADANQNVGIEDTAEPFQSLYRRYRPQRFEQVLGQDHVTLALRHAARDGHVAHAYLFSGPRGTGKTSTARILAKALNCDNPVDGEPCDVCASCRSIRAGSSFDVHELDAASNNGVDPMRDLVARAALATPGRWKVYIVDEVHMLSTAASNALLKTLEEPPAHVVFVLATTDAEKILPTIRSRTQHFEFHLLGEATLEGLLAQVATDAHLELPDGAVSVATRRGKGSARDALSVLDQVAASGVAEDDTELLVAAVAAVAERDPGEALTAIDAAVRNGRDPQQLAIELIELLRAGFLARVTGNQDATADPALEVVDRLGTVACVRAMELLGAALVAMRDAPEPRVTLEVALIRCAHPDADDSSLAFLERLERLERRVEELAGGAPATERIAREPERHDDPVAPPSIPASAESVASVDDELSEQVANDTTATPGRGEGPASARLALGAFAAPHRPAEPAPRTAQSAPPSPPPPLVPEAAPADSGTPPTRDELVATWGDTILQGLRGRLRAVYQAGRFVEVDESGVAVFALPNQAHLEHAAPLTGEVSQALGAHFGVRVPLRLIVERGSDGPSAISEGMPEDEDEVDALASEVRVAPQHEEQAVDGDGTSWAASRLMELFPGAELENQ